MTAGRSPGLATTRQQAAWEAVDRHGGTLAAAGELGISVSTLSSLVKAYCDRTGVDYPRGMIRRTRGDGAPALRLSERLEVIEAALVAIQAAEDARNKTLGHILAVLRRIENRTPILLVEPHVTNRRQADGGEGGKRERGRATDRMSPKEVYDHVDDPRRFPAKVSR